MKDELQEYTVAQIDQLLASVSTLVSWAGRLRDNVQSGEYDTNVVLHRTQTVLRGMGDVAGQQATLAYALARLASK